MNLLNYSWFIEIFNITYEVLEESLSMKPFYFNFVDFPDLSIWRNMVAVDLLL